MGTGYYGPGPTEAFVFNANECLKAWDGDPAYNKAAQKLREILQELDVLTQSPASRSAARAQAASSTGHERSDNEGDGDASPGHYGSYESG